MKTFLTQDWKPEDGAAAAEGALSLAVYANGVGVASRLLGTALRLACGDLNGSGAAYRVRSVREFILSFGSRLTEARVES